MPSDSNPCSTLLSNAHQALIADNFPLAMQYLQQLDDCKRGIATNIVDVEGHPVQKYVRDQTTELQPTEGYSDVYNYALLGINLLCALKHITETIPGSDTLQPHILAANYLKFIDEHPENAENSYRLLTHTILVEKSARLKSLINQDNFPDHENTQYKDAYQWLDAVKGFNDIYVKPQLIETSFNIKDQTGITYTVKITEEPLCDLTQDLINEYKQYEEKAWYLNADPLIKPFIKKACEHIIQIADHNAKNPDDYQPYPVLPTAMRHHLPGLRHAYKEIVRIQETGPDTWHPIFFGYRAGNTGHTIAAPDHENIRLTQLVMQQIQALVKAKDVSVTTWVSPNNPRSDESSLTQNNQSASTSAGMEQFHFGNVSIGAFRVATERLSSVPSQITDNLEPLKTLIGNIKSDVEAQSAVFIAKLQPGARIPSEDFLQTENVKYWHGVIVRLHEEVNALIENPSGTGELFTGHNRNLRLAVKIKLLMFAFNRFFTVLNPEQKETPIASLDGCVSGSYRTSIVSMYTIAEVLREYLLRYDTKHTYAEESCRLPLLTAIAESTHFQRLSALQGGNAAGAYGFTKSSLGAMIGTDKSSIESILVNRTAKYSTSIPPTFERSMFRGLTGSNGSPELKRQFIATVKSDPCFELKMRAPEPVVDTRAPAT